MSFIDLACCAGCLGTVGVRGDVLVLEWNRAYADGACADKACTDGACVDGACVNKAYADKACLDGAYTDKACSCLLLKFPQELNFFIVYIWCLILISCGVYLCSFFALRTCS